MTMYDLIKRLLAENERLETTLRKVAQSLDWYAHGCCRGFDDGAPLSTSKAVALAEEVVKLRNLRADAVHECALANINRVNLLEEALKEIRSRSCMNLAMNHNPYELTALLGDIYQIADAALAQESE